MNLVEPNSTYMHFQAELRKKKEARHAVAYMVWAQASYDYGRQRKGALISWDTLQRVWLEYVEARNDLFGWIN